MTKEQFYQALARYTQSEGYAQSAESKAMLNSTKMPRWASIAVGALFGPRGSWYVASADMSAGASKTAELEAEFQPMLSFTPLVLFKFLLGSIIILTAVEADDLSDEQILAVARTFDESLVNTTKYVAQRSCFFGVWKQQAGTVTGSLLFVFWDSAKAAHFNKTLQSQCFTKHFRKMTYLHPYAVDVSSRRVLSRQRIKFLQSISDDRFTKKVFGVQGA
jgi:hypothetical protein